MKSSDEEGSDYFPPRFKKYRDKELNYSRLVTYRQNLELLTEFLCEPDEDVQGWVFWSRLDDNMYQTFPKDHSVDSIPDVCASPKIRLYIRDALHKLISYPELDECLVQFWAPTRTSEGRTLLTTQFQPFALGRTYKQMRRNRLCEYRMGMCGEYNNSFYADAECSQEQLGLPGRVFLNKLPESTPAVEYYSPKEYPQRDLALRCGIKGSWAVPVFEHSGHPCVGVLEIVCELNGPPGWYFEEYLGWIYDILQIPVFPGLRCFDGYKLRKMQYGDENKARTAAFEELKMVYESVCRTHNLPLALTWVSSCSCDDLLQSQLQFSVLDYDDKFNVFIKASKVCHVRKGQVTGRTLRFPDLLYCSDVKQFSIAEFPLLPYARFCSLGGWFSMCLRSSHTGDKLYVLEFFLPESDENNENILTKLRLILGTMDKYFETFKLASGQGLGEALYVEVIDFQNGQKSHSIQMIPDIDGKKSHSIQMITAIGCISGLELLQFGGVMLQQDQQDKSSMDAISNGMDAVIEAQNCNLPSLDSLQNGKVSLQLDSSDQRSMDPSNNVQNVVTAERNIFGKRKMKDREHKKTGGRIEIPKEDILNCMSMTRKDAAAILHVGISTFKRVCREHGILRWPPRYVENVQPFPPLPVEKKGQTPQLNFDLHSNKAGFLDADIVTIKARYGETSIKFRLPFLFNLVELEREITKRLNLVAGTYYFAYKDEEADLIRIMCDEDVQEYIQSSRSLGNTPTLFVHDRIQQLPHS